MEVKLHKLVEGPVEDPMTGDIEGTYLAEVEGEVTHVTVIHECLDDCYEIANFLRTNIEPLVLETEHV